MSKWAADGTLVSSAHSGISRATVSAPPRSHIEPLSDPEEDQDTGDLPTGVNEDALDEDEVDTDRVTSDRE